jgi:hypothetical protein
MLPRLEDWSIGARIALVVATVIVLLLALALCSRLVDDTDAAPQGDIYADVAFDEAQLMLDKAALDEAYHQQLIKLFGVWLSGGAGDTRPISKGLRNARRAYGQAAEQIAKREKLLLEQQPPQRQQP